MILWAQRFFREHNPFIRHIVRRTRKYLEETRDASGEPYLKPIEVRLHGEGDTEAIKLPAYLEEAYRAAEDFTKLLSERLRSMGFLKTMLLRRLGSSIEAGRLSAERLLGTVECVDEEEDDAADGVEPVAASEFARNLTPQGEGSPQAPRRGIGGQPGARPEVRCRPRLPHPPAVAGAGLHHLQPVLRLDPLASRVARGRIARGPDRDLLRCQSIGPDP